jgi:2-polyprenyl-6-methoxyphenol hydroxylase-like FAD-dependent oxidoreductase
MSSKPTLIIGAGIAGPAVGIGLARAGIEAVVYEASAKPRDDEGVFLNLAPNGLAVLRGLGMAHALEGVGFQNDRLVFQNERARVLAEVAVGGTTLTRGGLSRALRQAAESLGVRFQFGKAIESIQERDGEVLARFADRTSATGSSVIGADGIHSRTRMSIFPEGPRPAYTGIINLGGIVRTDLRPTGTAMHMVFGRRAFFGYAVRPSGETYWFSNYAQKEEPSPSEFASVDADMMRQQLLTLHRDDPPEVIRILNAVNGPIGAYPIYDIQSLPAWHRGGVCLVGDAAHAIGPHVGQGASLALEDAFVVAKCLRDVQDATGAFTLFEQLRRGRVEPVVRQSRRTGQQKAPAGWIARKVSDFVLPIFLRKSAEAARTLYSYPLEWEERMATASAS